MTVAAADDRPFDGRVALVTGASGGIGGAIALALADTGAALALSYGTRGEAAERLGAQITSRGDTAITVGADLSDPDAPRRLIDRVEADLAPVDVLVSNAGHGRTQNWDDVSADDFDQTLAVNLRAPFLLAQRSLPGMLERRFGRILFISSVAAFTGGIIGPTTPRPKPGSMDSPTISRAAWLRPA